MSLRARLVLVLLGVFAPSASLAAWWHEQMDEARFDAALATYAVARMESGLREQAEASPFTFQEPPPRAMRRGGPPGGPQGGPRPGPGGPEQVFERMLREEYLREGAASDEARAVMLRERPQLWAYPANLVSLNPQAPKLDELRRAAALQPDGRAWYVEEEGLTWRCLLVKMEWDEGPAAWVLARRARERRLGPFGDSSSLYLALLVGVALMGAAWFAAGPLVRRVRKLEASVRASAREGYAVRVAGSEPARDELDALAQTFDEVAQALKAQGAETARRERALRAFVENTTHDTGLPLTVLHSQLAQLRDQVESGAAVDPARLRGALEELHYLAALLQNLSAMAALEAEPGTRTSAPVDLCAMVERVVARHRIVAGQKRIEFAHATPEAPLKVLGDVTLLEQALNNLVHNAVRYGHEGGHVAVVLDEDGTQRFLLRVVDDGPGVQPEELQRLAERSWRGDTARARHPDGRGIGLAIVRDVADRHGFELRFEAEQPHGLRATLGGPRCTA